MQIISSYELRLGQRYVESLVTIPNTKSGDIQPSTAYFARIVNVVEIVADITLHADNEIGCQTVRGVVQCVNGFVEILTENEPSVDALVQSTLRRLNFQLINFNNTLK